MNATRLPGIRTLREIAQGAKSHRTEWHYRIHRGISIYVTWALLHTPITANQTSLLSFASGFASAVLVLLGGPRQALLGLAGFYVYFLLDKVDGEIARYRGKQSLRGICLDYLGHMAVPPLVPLSMGGFLAGQSRIGWFWLAGAVGALAVLFARAAREIPAGMVLQKAPVEGRLFALPEHDAQADLASGKASRARLLSRVARLAWWLASFWPGLFLLACALGLYTWRGEYGAVLEGVFLSLCVLRLLFALATAVQLVRGVERRVGDCLRRIERIRREFRP